MTLQDVLPTGWKFTMSMKRPLIECPQSNCNLKEFESWTTAVYYPPVYDKYGNDMNEDKNIRHSIVECLTCGRIWRRHACSNHVEFIEIKQ